jgi:PPOX class probable F420-dependent enzyme
MDYTVNRSVDSRIADLPFAPLGGSPAFERPALEKFLAGNHIAVVSYLRKDGRPNQVPLWYAYRDGTLWFNVETGSAKYHALRRDGRVCVTVQDERPPYRAVIVEGTVEMLEGDQTLSHDLAVHYFGALGAKAYEQMAAEAGSNGSTTLKLHPTEVKGFDNTRMINAGLLAFARIRHRLPIPKRWL